MLKQRGAIQPSEILLTEERLNRMEWGHNCGQSLRVKTAQSWQIEGRTSAIKTLKYKALKNSADFQSKYFQIIATQNLKWEAPSITFENCKFSIVRKINLIIIFSFLLYAQMCSYITITIKYVIDYNGLFWQAKEWWMIQFSKLSK